MKKYQVIERFFSESRIIVTLNVRTVAEIIAKDLQEYYQKNGLTHYFEVEAIEV